MSDNIERIREELPFICASVKQVVNDKRQDGSYEFGKKKKGKKGKKLQEKRPVPTDHKTTADTHRTEHVDHNKMSAEENQCGNIIDLQI